MGYECSLPALFEVMGREENHKMILRQGRELIGKLVGGFFVSSGNGGCRNCTHGSRLARIMSGLATIQPKANSSASVAVQFALITEIGFHFAGTRRSDL